MSELYRDFIDGKADEIINSLGGTITPAPANAESYRDFLDRKFDDVINSIGNVKIKTFTYTGNGTDTNIINFPTKPIVVLGIYGNVRPGSNGGYISSFLYGQPRCITQFLFDNYTSSTSPRTNFIAFDSNIITITSDTAAKACNLNNIEYTVYYI